MSTKPGQGQTAKLEALGVDPVEALVRIGHEAEEAGDKELAVSAYKAAAPYIHPRLSAVDVETPAFGPFVVVSGLPAGMNSAELDRLEARGATLVGTGIETPPGALPAGLPEPEPAIEATVVEPELAPRLERDPKLTTLEHQADDELEKMEHSVELEHILSGRKVS